MNNKIDKSVKNNLSNKSISQNLLNELISPTIDLSVDYSELFIDDFIENEALKEIPIVKSVLGLIKGGIGINQFWFAKKLMTFIREFNKGQMEDSKVDAFSEKIKEEPKFGKKIAEKLMVIIDRNIDIIQTKVVSNLFSAYVNGLITYAQFNDIVITHDNLNPKAYDALFELEKINFEINSTNHDSIGRRDFEMEAFVTNSGFAIEPSDWFSGFALTEDGKNLFEFGIKPLKN